MDPKEASKTYGMFLLNAGKLNSYADKDRPCNVLVRWATGEARFKAWFTRERVERSIERTVIVVECCFVKKVCILLWYV